MLGIISRELRTWMHSVLAQLILVIQPQFISSNEFAGLT